MGYGLLAYIEVPYRVYTEYNNISIPLVPVNCPQACRKNRYARGARYL
jgi:hypothetical protein